MMTRNQWLLSKIAEEAAELSQRAMKAQQFGLGEVQPGQPLNNTERLIEEAHDLIATYALFMEENGHQFATFPSEERQRKRKEKMTKFLGLSQKLKMVE